MLCDAVENLPHQVLIIIADETSLRLKEPTTTVILLSICWSQITMWRDGLGEGQERDIFLLYMSGLAITFANWTKGELTASEFTQVFTHIIAAEYVT